ncbi:MAG TPA: 30S ribosomal protein S8 [Verrucomicrobiae bacterium]|nr:30S ribosomal protein S8 [Verrucomicrobiae bacterium]
MSLQSSDPIADLLTRIRNASLVGKTEVRVPSSKIKETIARELKKAGYITDVALEKATPQSTLVLSLSDSGKRSVITEIVRVSKPGRRVYVGADDIPRVKNGRGIVLISTSKGVMTGQQARKERVGGEVLCKIY